MMKVTAILPDNLVSEVKDLAHRKNISESLKIALEEWISLQKIKKLNRRIRQNPIKTNIDPLAIRELNRRVR